MVQVVSIAGEADDLCILEVDTVTGSMRGRLCGNCESLALARPPSARSSHRGQMAAKIDGPIGQGDSGLAEHFFLAALEAGQVPIYKYDADPNSVGVPQDIATMRIEPADSVLVVQRGQSATVSFRAFATMQVGGGEVEITNRTVFYVPDNYLVGEFPADGSSLFTTRLPTSSADPPQRGGKLTIQAMAASTDNPITTVTTTLTVKIIDSGSAAAGTPGATPAIPSDPGPEFTGRTAQPSPPSLVYPNDGVLLPPNMQQMEVHFQPGSKTGELYEILALERLFGVPLLHALLRRSGQVPAGGLRLRDRCRHGERDRGEQPRERSAHAGGARNRRKRQCGQLGEHQRPVRR